MGQSCYIQLGRHLVHIVLLCFHCLCQFKWFVMNVVFSSHYSADAVLIASIITVVSSCLSFCVYLLCIHQKSNQFINQFIKMHCIVECPVQAPGWFIDSLIHLLISMLYKLFVVFLNLTSLLTSLFLSLYFLPYIFTSLLLYFLTCVSTSFTIGPLLFQTGGHRRQPNLTLVFVFILCCSIFCYGCMFVVVFDLVFQY